MDRKSQCYSLDFLEPPGDSGHRLHRRGASSRAEGARPQPLLPCNANGTPPCSLTVAVGCGEGRAFPSPGGQLPSQSATPESTGRLVKCSWGVGLREFLIPVGPESLQVSR